MKKLLAMLAVILPMVFVAGCEPFPDDGEDDGEVEFVNKSGYRVSIAPQSREGWSGFSLAPGERKKIYDVYDVVFTFEPRFRVAVSRNESGRIVFVNASGNNVQVADD